MDSENSLPSSMLWQALISRILIPLLIALGLSISVYTQANIIAQMHFHNVETFFHYTLDAVPHDELAQAWKPRVFSGTLAKASRELRTPYAHVPTGNLPRSEDSHPIAQWTALWFLAICLIYAIGFRKHALFFMFGTYAGVAFGYLPGIVDRIYPWDMPALFFYALIISLIASRRNPLLIMGLIWLGISFKETVGVLALFPLLFGERSLRRRFGLTAISLAGCALVKIAIDLWTRNTDLGLTMTHRPEGEALLLVQNLRHIAEGIPLFANAGTLLALFLIPRNNRTIWGLKTIALLFVVGNMTFGIITELRIWFEMIPVALYAFQIAGNEPTTAIQASSSPTPNSAAV